MNNVHRPVLLLLAMTLFSCLFMYGCGNSPSFTIERYKSLVSSDDVNTAKVSSVLGTGEAVENEYTSEQITLHELPADTTFMRWQHPDEPTTYSFIGFSEDRAVHFTTLHTE